MLEYDKIDISEGIDVNESSNSRECSLCHFWYFIDKNFNYQKYLCNGCHDMSMKGVSIKNVVIVYSKGNAYRIHFWYMSKDDAISIIHNSNLIDKKEHNFFLHYIKKVSQKTYYQKNKDKILNRAKAYYENNKEILRERTKNRYRELSADEKYKKKTVSKRSI